MNQMTGRRAGKSRRFMLAGAGLALLIMAVALVASLSRIPIRTHPGSQRCPSEGATVDDGTVQRVVEADVVAFLVVSAVNIESARADLGVGAILTDRGLQHVAAAAGLPVETIRKNPVTVDLGAGLVVEMSATPDGRGMTGLGVNAVAPLVRGGDFPFDVYTLRLESKVRLPNATDRSPTKVANGIPVVTTFLSSCTGVDHSSERTWIRTGSTDEGASTFTLTTTRTMLSRLYVLVIAGLPLLLALLLLFRLRSNEAHHPSLPEGIGVIAALIAVPSLRSVCVPSYIEAPSLVDILLTMGPALALFGWCWHWPQRSDDDDVDDVDSEDRTPLPPPTNASSHLPTPAAAPARPAVTVFSAPPGRPVIVSDGIDDPHRLRTLPFTLGSDE